MAAELMARSAEWQAACRGARASQTISWSRSVRDRALERLQLQAPADLARELGGADSHFVFGASCAPCDIARTISGFAHPA